MRLDKELLKTKQYKTARGYHARSVLFEYALKPFSLWEWTAKHYDFRGAKTVLEVGCGPGEFWTEAEHLSNSLEHIYVTDFSDGMLSAARETLEHSPLLTKMHFEVADVEALKYSDKTFDVVFAHLMLYHPKSQERALGEIRRVLKDDGWAGITTLGIESVQSILSLAHHVDPRFPPYSVTVEPFDERIADVMLPKYFKDVQKDAEVVVIHVPTVDVLMEFIRTHPVTQTLQWGDVHFAKFREEAAKIITLVGYFEVTFKPVIYQCKAPRSL